MFQTNRLRCTRVENPHVIDSRSAAYFPAQPASSPRSPSVESALSAGRSRARLVANTIIVITVQTLVAALGFAGMQAANIARAYVTGEAQYSKAQKEAVIELMRYSESRSDKAFERFEASIAVLQGDHDARIALEAPKPDVGAARVGFAKGGNAPADIPLLITGFQLLRGWDPFARAVDDWRRADSNYVRLTDLAHELRSRPVTNPRTARGDASAIDQIDSRMTLLEQHFSNEMGDAARIASETALYSIWVLSLLICTAGAFASWRLQRVAVRIAERLAAARDRAEVAVKARTEFLANMSHEVRTPLTGIIGFAGLLAGMTDLPASAQKYADRIETAGQTLLAIVNDILDFSKIEAGQLTLDPAPFDPSELINSVLHLIEGQAAQKNITLAVDIATGVPSFVVADEARVRQILLNLLANAVKFTPAGSVTVRVDYEPARVDCLRISVRDTGIGIPRDQLEMLFERFTQADGSISRRFGGTGLGLAICRRLAELMGGAVGAESIEGEESTFWFTVIAPPTHAPPRADDVRSDSVNSRPSRILIVDDVAQNRELVSVLLSPFGHLLYEAEGGAEAVQAAMREPFDLILMDLQMPGMDGLAATRAIRATSDVNHATPIIALSANVMAEHVEACLEAGMHDHVAKPIVIADLLEKVACWTGSDLS